MPFDDSGLALSVIVVSFNSLDILVRCLEALIPQINPKIIELLVVGRWQEVSTLQDKYPEVKFIQAPAEETIPRMRLRGITAANGRLVALLEDDCLVTDQWRQTIIAAHNQTDQPAIGGAIKPDNYPKLLDWAVYFCEYARFMAPLSKPVAALPGNNVSYKREALPPVASLPNGLYEVFLHWQWQQDGRTLLTHPNMEVTNINRWTATNVTRIPFQHGRCFAALRSKEKPIWNRLVRAALTPLLPILQVGRIIKEAGKRGRYLPKLILALPWIILFQTSWALGELAGNLSNKQSQQTGWQ